MYSQQELDDAVAAGVLKAGDADALRTYIESQRTTAIPDEEQFRLLTGFNDIFVSIAAAILLFALGWIGQSIGKATGLVITDNDGALGPSFLAPFAVTAASWGLALFFTARRRMALPSILLLLSFAIGVLLTSAFLLVQIVGTDRLNDNVPLGTMIGGASAAIAAGAAWLHWRRFRVPITVAVGAAAVAGLFIALVVGVVQPESGQSTKTLILSLVLMLGIGVFLFAMWWDSSDRARLTRRSDVAFWLHLLAAPMIVHPVFSLLGLNDGNATIGEGLVVVVLYVALALTALAIDRRALLVSALAYVLLAMQQLFQQFGAVELNVALTALVIGSALLMLSAFWHQARRAIVRPLPESIRARLPILDRMAPAAAQTAA